MISPELVAEEAAEPPPAGADAPRSETADDDPPKQKKEKKRKGEAGEGTTAAGKGSSKAPEDEEKKDRFGKVEVFGRVAFRAELERHERAAVDPDDPYALGRVDSLDLTVPLARLGARYRAPGKWLSAQIEVDVAEGLELMDAWGMARTDHFSARAGHFKMPFSAIEMESSFTLPLARRGLVHDVLVDELEVAGRRPGVAFGARHRLGIVRPSLVIGAFQGSVLVDEDPDDRDVELFSERALDAQSFVARAEAEIWDVTAGVNYEHRVGTDTVLEPKHYWTFGADVVLDTELAGHGLRVWAEVMDGSSWFEHRLKPLDGYDAIFVMTRFISAFRIGGTRREAFYVEPYAMFAVLDPDMDVVSDIVVEEAIGVNVGLWKRVRVGLEAEFQKAQPNFPERYFLDENGDRKALVANGQIAF